MRRVINRRAYDTKTAEIIATTDGIYQKPHGNTWHFLIKLYRTPKGAWFLVETEEEWIEGDETPEEEKEIHISFMVLDGSEGALAWISKNECELTQT